MALEELDRLVSSARSSRLYPKPMARKRQRRSLKPKLPRAPLPKQTGGAHEDKSKRPFRKEKHKKRMPEE